MIHYRACIGLKCGDPCAKGTIFSNLFMNMLKNMQSKSKCGGTETFSEIFRIQQIVFEHLFLKKKANALIFESAFVYDLVTLGGSRRLEK